MFSRDIAKVVVAIVAVVILDGSSQSAETGKQPGKATVGQPPPVRNSTQPPIGRKLRAIQPDTRKQPVPMPVVPPNRSANKPAVGPQPAIKPRLLPVWPPAARSTDNVPKPVLPGAATPPSGIGRVTKPLPDNDPAVLKPRRPNETSSLDPLPLVRGPTEPERFVILMGDLRCHDVTDGGLIEAGDDQLRAAVGVYVGYRDGSTHIFGDYFDFGDVDEGWVAGPILERFVATINEQRPGPDQRELGRRDPLIDFVRIAVVLYEWDERAGPFELARSGLGAPDVTRLLNEVDFTGTRLRPENPSVTGMARLKGRDVSAFGNALAKVTRNPEYDDLIGVREWHFFRDDLHRIVHNAVSFGAVNPARNTLRDHRDRLRGKFLSGFSHPRRLRDVPGYPDCVRQFEMFGDDSHYTGELWFVKVPERIFERWTLWSEPYRRIEDMLPER